MVEWEALDDRWRPNVKTYLSSPAQPLILPATDSIVVVTMMEHFISMTLQTILTWLWCNVQHWLV